MRKQKKVPAQKHDWQCIQRLVLVIIVVLVFILGAEMTNTTLRADSTTGLVAPPIFPEGIDTCNLGLAGACDDTGAYIDS